MKNKFCVKIVMLVVVIMLFSISMVYAKTNSYILTDEYIFEITKDIPNQAYINIFIGDIDATTYSDGTTKITPTPNDVKEDKFGNKILKYTYSSLVKNKGGQFVINIEKNIKTNDNVVRYDTNLINETITKYLSATPRIESDNQYIIAKAQELTKDCETDYEKIKNIFEYVNMFLTYDTSSIYRNKGALSALLTGRGVCEEYVTLFVSLCRASDIPARAVTGYNTDRLAVGQTTEAISMYHTWPEVYIENQGWVPLEITAEYYVQGKKEVYWPGFLSLGDQSSYVVEGIYNSELSEIEWYGVNFKDYKKYITLTEERYFLDINEHWAKSHIEHLYNDEIIKGYEDGTFLPDNNVTRAEYICMLARTLRELEMDYLLIDDIYYPIDFEDNWVKEDYDRLMQHYAFYGLDVENGAGSKTITEVFGDTLNMNEPIKREEVVALLAPFLKQVDYLEEYKDKTEEESNQEDEQVEEQEENEEVVVENNDKVNKEGIDKKSSKTKKYKRENNDKDETADDETTDDETTDDETADDETTDDETTDDETTDDETTDDETVDDETTDDETADDETADDETTDDETVDDETTDDETTDDETTDDETTDDETTDDETTDDETTDDENKNQVLTDIEDSKFKKAIITSYANNIIVGYEDGTFKPNNTITRGEIATIFDRMITKEK